MKDLYIYGTGGHAKVVFDIASALGYNVCAFLDDAKTGEFLGRRIVDLSALSDGANVFVAIGDNKIRWQKFASLKAAGFALPSLIHPSAVVSSSASIGAGTCLMPLVVVNFGASIGAACILNTACVVEHDCRVGDFTHIAGRAYLAGAVSVGAGSFLGLASGAIQSVKIAPGVTLAAGAIAVRDLTQAGGIYKGIPAK
ncbi:MAG: NeuD/PglB/VioB family sugar acetyltransferase [Helicobacteraceae bacterium]